MSTQVVKRVEFDQIKPRFVELVDENTFNKEVSFAMQAMAKNPKLMECSKMSLISAVLNVAQFELSLNPIMHQAYLVPFWNRQSNCYEAVLMAGYQGLIDKICDAGVVRNIQSVVVYENDKFSYSAGTSPEIRHEPTRGERGAKTHVYAVAHFLAGGNQFEVMDWSEVEKVRGTSISYKAIGVKSIWGVWENEMAKKTVVRRLAKYLPKNSNKTVRGITALDDKDFMPDWSKISYCQTLINSSMYDDETKNRLEHECEDMNLADIDNLIATLQANQIPHIDRGTGSQTVRSQELKNMVEKGGRNA